MKTTKPRVHGTAHNTRDVSAGYYEEAVAAGLVTASAIEGELLRHGIELRENRVRDSLRGLVNLGLLRWVSVRDGQVMAAK